ncbi:MAG: hypothetical protein J5590_01525, partial [Clostridia bacterium]|nr:hypothetical protein [Clostridia bacterium]
FVPGTLSAKLMFVPAAKSPVVVIPEGTGVAEGTVCTASKFEKSSSKSVVGSADTVVDNETMLNSMASDNNSAMCFLS